MDTQGTFSIFILFFFKEEEIRLIFLLHIFLYVMMLLLTLKQVREMSTGRYTRRKDPEITLP